MSVMVPSALSDASSQPGPIISGPQNMGVQLCGAAANTSDSAVWSTRCLATTDAGTEPREDPAAVRLPHKTFKRSPEPALSPTSCMTLSQEAHPGSVMQERIGAPFAPRSSRKRSSSHSQRMLAEEVAAQLAAAQPAALTTTPAPPISCSATPGVPPHSCSRRTAGGSWTSGGHSTLVELAARTRPRQEHDPFVDEPRSERSSATTDTADAVPNGMKASWHATPWLTCLVVGMHKLLGCEVG